MICHVLSVLPIWGVGKLPIQWISSGKWNMGPMAASVLAFLWYPTYRAGPLTELPCPGLDAPWPNGVPCQVLRGDHSSVPYLRVPSSWLRRSSCCWSWVPVSSFPFSSCVSLSGSSFETNFLLCTIRFLPFSAKSLLCEDITPRHKGSHPISLANNSYCMRL